MASASADYSVGPRLDSEFLSATSFASTEYFAAESVMLSTRGESEFDVAENAGFASNIGEGLLAEMTEVETDIPTTKTQAEVLARRQPESEPVAPQEDKENVETKENDEAPVGAETANKPEAPTEQEGGETSEQAVSEAKKPAKKSALGSFSSKLRFGSERKKSASSTEASPSKATGGEGEEGETPKEAEQGESKTVGRKPSLKNRIFRRPFSKKTPATTPAVEETKSADEDKEVKEPAAEETEEKPEPTTESPETDAQKAEGGDVPEASAKADMEDADVPEESPYTVQAADVAPEETGEVIPPLKTAELGRSRSSIDCDSALFAGTSASIAAELKAHGVNPSPRTPKPTGNKPMLKDSARQTPPVEEEKDTIDAPKDSTDEGAIEKEEEGESEELAEEKEAGEKPTKTVVRQPSLIARIFTFGRARPVEMEVEVDPAEARDLGHDLKKEDVEKLHAAIMSALKEQGVDPDPISEKSVDDCGSALEYFLGMKTDLDMEAGDLAIRDVLVAELGAEHPLIADMEKKEKQQEIAEIDAYLKKRNPGKADKIFIKEPEDFETTEEYYKFLQTTAQKEGVSLLFNLRLKLGKDHPLVKAVEETKEEVDEEEKGDEEVAAVDDSEAAKQEGKSKAEGENLEDTAIISGAELPLSEGGIVSSDAVKVEERALKGGAVARDETGGAEGGCTCLCFGGGK